MLTICNLYHAKTYNVIRKLKKSQLEKIKYITVHSEDACKQKFCSVQSITFSSSNDSPASSFPPSCHLCTEKGIFYYSQIKSKSSKMNKSQQAAKRKLNEVEIKCLYYYGESNLNIDQITEARNSFACTNEDFISTGRCTFKLRASLHYPSWFLTLRSFPPTDSSLDLSD